MFRRWLRYHEITGARLKRRAKRTFRSTSQIVLPVFLEDGSIVDGAFIKSIKLRKFNPNGTKVGETTIELPDGFSTPENELPTYANLGSVGVVFDDLIPLFIQPLSKRGDYLLSRNMYESGIVYTSVSMEGSQLDNKAAILAPPAMKTLSHCEMRVAAEALQKPPVQD